MDGTVETGIIGDEVLRKEDRKFLLGKGRFVDDIRIPGELHAVFVRSTHAHAEIGAVDAAAAEQMLGVVKILTGADMAADGVGTIPFMWTMSNADGTPMAQPPRWGLARERVRHVGEAITVVIAETVAEAQEAADTIVVVYVPLDAVTGSKAALVDGAPQLHSEAPGNRIYSWGRGDTDATDKAIAEAPHSVSLELVNNRIACAAIETRACLAVPDPAGGQTTLYDATQAPLLCRKSITDALCVWDAIQKAKAL